MQGVTNVTKPGLHGGKVSSIALSLDITPEMNGIVYTCQATNEALQRSVHDAITLEVLCKSHHLFPLTSLCQCVVRDDKVILSGDFIKMWG